MIDKIYIEEAIRIRKEYLKNLLNVTKFEKVYQEILEKLEKEKEKVSNFDADIITQDDIFKYVKQLEVDLNLILDKIRPYIEKINDLDNEQRILYNNIKEKYIDITDEEIYKEIIPVIEEIDENFEL